MQGTLAHSQVQKDPLRHRATKPKQACAHAMSPGPRAPPGPVLQERPPQWKARVPQLARSAHPHNQKKSPHSGKDPVQPKRSVFSSFIYRKKTEAADNLPSVYRSPFPLGTQAVILIRSEQEHTDHVSCSLQHIVPYKVMGFLRAAGWTRWHKNPFPLKDIFFNKANTYIYYWNYTVIAVQLLSHLQLFATPWTTARQASLSFTISQSLLKFCLLSQWCHPTISPSVALFSSCPQSFPASGSFPISWLFTSGGQSVRASAPASVLPMNIQGSFPLGLTGFISLLSKGLSRAFSTIWKNQFFGTQLSLWSNSHIHTRLLKNYRFDYMEICRQSDASAF